MMYLGCMHCMLRSLKKNMTMFMQVIFGKRLCTVIAVVVHKFLIRLALTHFFKYIMSTTSIMAGVAVL